MSYVVEDTFLALTPGCFPDNLGDVSDEQGERFHQDISVIETRYQGKLNDRMMGDYCWYLQRESDAPHKRKAGRQKHF